MQGELAADTGAWAGAERFVDARPELAQILGQEPVRVEGLRVGTPRWVALRDVKCDEHPIPLTESVAPPSDRSVGLGLAVIAGSHRCQAQRLVDDAA